MRRKSLTEITFPYIMVLPTLLLLFFFAILPLFNGLVDGFFQRGLVANRSIPSLTPKFIGIQNFVQLFSDSDFLASFGRTVLFAVIGVPLTTAVSLGLALLLQNRSKLNYISRTIIYWPYMVSLIIVGVVWKWILGYNSGILNYLVHLVGGKPVRWLLDLHMAQVMVVLVWMWAKTGFYMVIFITGLGTISKDYYEVARIDGAGSWTVFWKITLPLLRPIMLIVVVLLSIDAFKVYALVVSLTNGGPGRATVFLVQNIYDTAFRRPMSAGYAAAQSAFLFVILVILTVLQLRLGREDAA